MRAKTTAIVAATAVALTSVFLAGCGPKATAGAGQPTSPAAPGASSTASAAAQAVKDLTPGNCTLYTKADAIKLLGGVNINNKALDIATEGGTKIDQCSYLDLKGLQDLQGVTYAVVRYDSAATAFAKAQKVQTDMLGSAASNN